MNPLLEKRPFRVVANNTIATDTFQLLLAPVTDAARFEFKAGQWVYLFLEDPTGGKPWRAAFSIASAPGHEPVELAIKLHGDFTRRSQALKAGDVVELQGPFGLFVPPPGNAPLVMFGGGIGVTPFMSVIREALSKNDPREMVLIYSSSRKQDLSYEDELRAYATQFPQFKLAFTLTREAPAGWDGLTRRIDARMLNELGIDLATSQFMMCGPNPFMDAIVDLLKTLDIDTKTRLHRERFS